MFATNAERRVEKVGTSGDRMTKIIPFHEAAAAVRLAQAEAIKPSRERHVACPMQVMMAMALTPFAFGLMMATAFVTRDD